MPITFNNNNIRFRYPENWQLDEEATENGWTLTLQSPNTVFLVISCRLDSPPPEQVLLSVRKALAADYPELEAFDTIDSLDGQPAAGLDMQFISLDLTITCGARSLFTDVGTLLVMWQAADLDWESMEPVVRAICASLEVGDE